MKYAVISLIMRSFAVAACALLSLLSPFTSAQTLSIGIERGAQIIPSYPDLARDVQLASRGGDFVAVWRNANGRIVATMIDSGGNPWTSVTPLSQKGGNPRIVGMGHGYLAAWETGLGHGIDVAHIYDDGSKGLDFVPVTDFDLEKSSMRIAAAGYRALLVWITRKGETATLSAVVLSAYGERLSRTIAISEDDATLSNPSVARAGSSFIVAFQTARGIETAFIDRDGGSVTRQLVSAESAKAMTVVSTPAGPVIFYTPAQTNATYSLAPGEAPQLVAEGRLVSSVETDRRPVVALSMPDGRVALFQTRAFREARELSVPGAPIETANSIAWDGTHLLIASGTKATDVVLAGLEGQTARSAMLGFRFTNRHLVDVATAGGVDLLAWFDSIEQEFVDDEGLFTPEDYAFGRFRDTVALDGGGVRTIWNPVVASDGVSAFLVSGASGSGSTAAVAQLVPVDGAPSPLIELGEGRVLEAIWDGMDFIVFHESSAAIHATRIRRDGTILSPAGGAVLARGENVTWLQAVPTSAGFVLAYNKDTRTRVTAFTHAFTTIRAVKPIVVQANEEDATISITGNGADRVVFGMESKLPGYGPASRRTMMLNERGEQQWSAKDAARAGLGVDGAFVLLFPRSDYLRPVDAVLWSSVEKPSDVSAGTNRARFDTLTAVRPPLPASSPQRTIVAYARLAILPTGDIVRRLVTRTVTVLPKEEARP